MLCFSPAELQVLLLGHSSHLVGLEETTFQQQNQGNCLDICSFTPFPLPVAMRFDALPNQDSKALGVPTVLQPHRCCKGSSSLSCCLSQLLGALGPRLFTVLHTVVEGCKSQRGQLHPPGGLGQGRAIGEHLQLLCWSRTMRKILDFLTLFLSGCSDCARSLTCFPSKRSWACYSDCINAKDLLIKEANCPYLHCLPQ